MGQTSVYLAPLSTSRLVFNYKYDQRNTWNPSTCNTYKHSSGYFSSFKTHIIFYIVFAAGLQSTFIDNWIKGTLAPLIWPPNKKAGRAIAPCSPHFRRPCITGLPVNKIFIVSTILWEYTKYNTATWWEHFPIFVVRTILLGYINLILLHILQESYIDMLL